MQHQANQFYIKLNDMDVILGIIFGGIVAFFAIKYYRSRKNKSITEQQSVILVEKIKNVCKLVSVEGDFSEIYEYKNVEKLFLNLVETKKKAIVKVKAKALIGYDLKKIHVVPNNNSKTISIKNFPEAEVLSVETDIEYYDKSEHVFNRFKEEDLTTINKEAKQVIVDKIPESGLLESANKEALEAIGIIKSIVETVGWKLDIESLELPQHKRNLLK